MRGRVASLFAPILVILLLGAGCSGGSETDESAIDAGESTTTVDESSSSSEDDATTTSEAATTSSESTTTTEATTTTEPTTTLPPITDSAEGSGCTPGEGALPDGRWFGFVAFAGDGTIEFDLACWYTGAAAERAAEVEGWSEPPPNDYYVSNNNETLRTLALDPAVNVTFYDSGDLENPTVGSYADWLAWRETLPEEARLGVWVDLVGGVVVIISEQWVP